MDTAIADQIDALFAALAAPFREDQIRWRPAQGGQLPYLNARDVQDRLDEVLGPQNWWAEFAPSERAVICRLTVRLPDGQLLTKADAGGYPVMIAKTKEGSKYEDVKSSQKGGFSDAFKRAAVMFGIARHLGQGAGPARAAQARDQRPAPPPVSRSEEPRQAPQGQQDQPQQHRDCDRQQGQGQGQGPPKTGRALFAWAKGQQEATDKDVVKWLNKWGKTQGFPARLVDWSNDQVAIGHEAAGRKLLSAEAANGTR